MLDADVTDSVIGEGCVIKVTYYCFKASIFISYIVDSKHVRHILTCSMFSVTSSIIRILYNGSPTCIEYKMKLRLLLSEVCLQFFLSLICYHGWRGNFFKFFSSTGDLRL